MTAPELNPIYDSPIDPIHESTTNPRRTFDETTLQERSTVEPQLEW